MFDIQLRSLKDRVFDPCCQYIPSYVKPLHITEGAYVAGLLSCSCAIRSFTRLSLTFWFINRALDCLDGALARHRRSASDLGGFLDLLCDFIIYSLLPISISIGQNGTPHCWEAVAILETTFHVNNFILFYVAAVAEKGAKMDEAKSKELTSVMMRPALIEGMESGILFTLMLAFPGYVEAWSWLMAGLVTVGIVQRSLWVTMALK